MPKRDILYLLKNQLEYLDKLGISFFPNFPEFQVLTQKETILTSESLEELRDQIKKCSDCILHQHRKQVVLGENNNNSKLMIIGDYPDKEDDYSGKPFTGPLKETLQKMLLSIGFRREDFYITLCVKCKPPRERIPEDDEIEACKKYLFKEIRFIRPKLILSLGFLPPKVFTKGKLSLNKLRGKPFVYEKSMIVFTYHPRYMFKEPSVKRLIWEDLKLFKRLYEENN